MNTKDILASIDQEIATLHKVRALLNDKTATKAAKPVVVKKRRKLSADARKRIADAQRKRWAAQKAKGK